MKDGIALNQSLPNRGSECVDLLAAMLLDIHLEPEGQQCVAQTNAARV